MYGEHAHSEISNLSNTLDQGDYIGINWWTSGDHGDTTFCTIFPPNFFTCDDHGYAITKIVPRQTNWSVTATSRHPGGGEFCLLRRLGAFAQKLDQLVEPPLDHTRRHRLQLELHKRAAPGCLPKPLDS